MGGRFTSALPPLEASGGAAPAVRQLSVAWSGERELVFFAVANKVPQEHLHTAILSSIYLSCGVMEGRVDRCPAFSVNLLKRANHFQEHNVKVYKVFIIFSLSRFYQEKWSEHIE